MKKILFLLLIAAAIIGGCSSCAKSPNDLPDLTTNLTGTYVGTYGDSLAGGASTLTSNASVVVTKIDNTHIQVTPASPNFISFIATLSTASSGIYMTTNGNTVYIGSQLYTNLPVPYNGGYDPATNSLFFSLKVSSGSAYYYEVYAGSK